jgi:hypothetical protein
MNGFIISCDDCSMQCTSACDDCVVTYLLRHDVSGDGEALAAGDGLALDGEQARVVELFGAAGLVPRLRFRRQQVAG